MSEAEKIRNWMTQKLEESGMSVTEWASASGVHKSTIFKALRKDYPWVPSSRTLAKLGMSAEDLRQQRMLDDMPELDGVSYGDPVELGIGPEQWHFEELPRQQVSPFTEFKFPEYKELKGATWLGQIVGDHYSPYYMDNDVVHVLDMSLGFRHVTPGASVLLHRRNADEKKFVLEPRWVDSVTRHGITLGRYPGGDGQEDRVKIGEVVHDAEGEETRLGGVIVGLFRSPLKNWL